MTRPPSSPEIRTAGTFFYGTLMDPDVRTLVVGRRIPDDRVRPAVLVGYRRVFVTGAAYPGIEPAAGAQVDGILVDGLTADEIERLARYEGYQYRRCVVAVRVPGGATVPALCFRTVAGVRLAPRDWSLEDWRRRHKDRYLANLRRASVPVSNRA